MNRRELIAGAALIAGASQAQAFGVGKLGSRFGRGGALGGARAISAAYPTLRAAYASGYGSIGMIGDSLTTGWGAGTASVNGKNITGAYALAMPSIVRQQLAAFGLNAIDGCIPNDNAVNAGVGGATSTAALTAFDPRRGPGSGWQINSVALAAGGYMAQGNAAGTGWTNAPIEVFDTIENFCWTQAAGAADFTVSLDGGASIGTITSTAASAIKKTTFSVARGVHTITYDRVGGAGSAFVAFTRTRDSTQRQLSVVNLGVVGAKTSDWIVTTSPFSPLSLISNIACHAWLIQLGPNDANAGVAPATYSANLQTIITACKAAGGDVQLVVPTPAGGASAAYNIPQTYIDANYSLSVSNSLPPPIDLNALFVSYAASSADYFDGVHLLASGYLRTGKAIAARIRS